MKLAFALVGIENLKKKAHLSQSEVASLTKQMETSDAHKKLAIKALERSNKENAAWESLNSKVVGLTEEGKLLGGLLTLRSWNGLRYTQFSIPLSGVRILGRE